jgi:hypothetical protein
VEAPTQPPAIATQPPAIATQPPAIVIALDRENISTITFIGKILNTSKYSIV